MRSRNERAAFRDRYGPWALVAGGSDGIGAAFAREAASRGLHIALVARRREPLETFAESLARDHGIETRAIAADLTGDDAAATIGRETRALDIGLLVYNAGSNPEAGRFLDQPVSDAMHLVALSCRGPVALAHHFGARLRERTRREASRRGGIVLMSSIASLAGSGLQATYAATKAFDTSLAEGLWVELAPDRIDVLGVLAGATRTETMLGQRPESFETAMDPAEVARGALDHLGKGPNWIPGDENRATARGLWPVPRIPIVNGMTQATAALFELSLPIVEGREFDEDETEVD